MKPFFLVNVLIFYEYVRLWIVGLKWALSPLGPQIQPDMRRRDPFPCRAVRRILPIVEINLIITRDRIPPHCSQKFALTCGRILSNARSSSPSHPAKIHSPRSTQHPHRPYRSFLFPSCRFLFCAPLEFMKL